MGRGCHFGLVGERVVDFLVGVAGGVVSSNKISIF